MEAWVAIFIFNVPARTIKREREAFAGVPLLTSGCLNCMSWSVYVGKGSFRKFYSFNDNLWKPCNVYKKYIFLPIHLWSFFLTIFLYENPLTDSDFHNECCNTVVFSCSDGIKTDKDREEKIHFKLSNVDYFT